MSIPETLVSTPGLWAFLGDEANNRALGLLLTFGTILVSAVTVIITVRQNLYLRRKEAREATYTFLAQFFTTDAKERERAVINLLRAGKKYSATHSEEVMLITDHLNQLELVAMFIREDIMLEQRARDFVKNTIAWQWKIAEPFVKDLRLISNNSTIYSEIERTAGRS